MAETFQIFEPTYQFIDGRLDVFLGERANLMIAEVAGPLRTALALYVILYGFAILRGAITEPIIDLAVRSLKLAFIYLLATTSAYSSFVGALIFHALPDTLARALSGQAVSNVGSAVDLFLARTAYLAEKVAQQASFADPTPWIQSATIFVMGSLAAALGFGVIMIAKVALALLVAIGPLFIACALFEGPRRYFFGWLSQAVNYLVLFALILAVFQLVLSLVDQQWSRIDGSDPLVGGYLFIALCILSAIFFLQTPVIAAGVAGGASVGLQDFANAAFPRTARHGAAATTQPGHGPAGRGGAARPSAGSSKS